MLVPTGAFIQLGRELGRGNLTEAFYSFIWGIVSLIGCIYIDCARRMKVVFDENGISIVNDIFTAYSFLSWDKILYGSYSYDYKGNCYLILSENEIDEKKQKQLRTKSSLSLKMRFETDLVIYLGHSKLIPQIEEMLAANKISIDKNIPL